MRPSLAAVATALAALSFAADAQAQTDAETLGKSGGYTYVRDVMSVEAQTEDAKNVPCPGEQFVISGGADLGGGPEASFMSVQSSQFNPGWTTGIWDGTGSPWQAEIFAICKKMRLQDVSGGAGDHGTAPGPATETETAKCEEGTMLGGGGYFAGQHFDRWYLNSTHPKGNGWKWTGYHLEGADGSEIAAEVRCEIGAEKPDVRTKSVETDKELVKVKVGCKKGVAISGGASASEDAVNAHLVKTVPTDDGDAKKIPDDGWAIAYENDGLVEQKFTAHVVCG